MSDAKATAKQPSFFETLYAITDEEQRKQLIHRTEVFTFTYEDGDGKDATVSYRRRKLTNDEFNELMVAIGERDAMTTDGARIPHNKRAEYWNADHKVRKLGAKLLLGIPEDLFGQLRREEVEPITIVLQLEALNGRPLSSQTSKPSP